MSTTEKPKHIGRNISRIRELKGMKQEALASAIGVSQQTISSIESSEKVDAEKLKLIANELGISVDAIENFSEENIVNYINNFYDSSGNNGIFNPQHCTFNPIDKLVEVFEENKSLYKQLIQVEKDKVAYLEKLLNK